MGIFGKKKLGSVRYSADISGGGKHFIVHASTKEELTEQVRKYVLGNMVDFPIKIELNRVI